MTKSTLTTIITGAALSIAGLAVHPAAHGAASAATTPVGIAAPSHAGLCFRIVGVAYHYTVVAYPCPQHQRYSKH